VTGGRLSSKRLIRAFNYSIKFKSWVVILGLAAREELDCSHVGDNVEGPENWGAACLGCAISELVHDERVHWFIINVLVLQVVSAGQSMQEPVSHANPEVFVQCVDVWHAGNGVCCRL